MVRVNVSEVIDNSKLTSYQIRIIILCFLVLIFDGFDNQAVGYVAPLIANAWHIEKSALGPVFGVGLAAYTIGTLCFGTLADYFGRKTVIIATTLSFGFFSLLTAFAYSLESLMVLRFMTGLALGGALPNTIALVTEYSPKRARGIVVTSMACGFSIGAFIGGLVAAQLIPAFGWPGVFYAGALAPIVLVPVLAFGMPESIRLLVLKQTRTSQLASIVARINPALSFDKLTTFVVDESSRKGFPVKHLFTEGRARATTFLWIAFFMNITALQFLASWLTTVINASGVPIGDAVVAASMFQIGGTVGAIIFGSVIDRFGPKVLALAYLIAAIFIAMLGAGGYSVAAISALVFMSGFGVVGGQNTANAFSGLFYPTFIRSSGVGWALGIGRIGAILGPVVGGILISMHLSLSTLFYIFAIPDLLALCAILMVQRPRQLVESASIEATIPL